MTYSGIILYCFFSLPGDVRHRECTAQNADVILYSETVLHKTRAACYDDLARVYAKDTIRNNLRDGDTVVVNCGIAFEVLGK